MKYKILTFNMIVTLLISFKCFAINKDLSTARNFNIKKDLLLVQYDCKTDVDDLQSVAAFMTLMSEPKFSKIHYHAVAGTYGIQEGLYVPPNDLFKLAFGTNWTDANANLEEAIEQVKAIIKATLSNQGDIWIADAGQSDFTAEVIRSIQSDLPEINISQRFHVVQHSDWNEKVTSQDKLLFVKKNSDYLKIPDGNEVGNGTPGFRSAELIDWENRLTNPQLIEIWQLAINLSNKYNGKEDRYKNEAIFAGGLDFSDLAEVCWILGVEDIKDINQFFNDYAN